MRISLHMRYTLWQQCWLHTQFRNDAVDVLHCTSNSGLPLRSPHRRVLINLDAIDHAYRLRRTWLLKRPSASAILNRPLLWITSAAADHVITFSEQKQRNLIRCLGIPRSRITIREAADPTFDPWTSKSTQRSQLTMSCPTRPSYMLAAEKGGECSLSHPNRF